MFRNARSRLILASALMSSLVTALVLALVYVTTNAIIENETRSVVDAELAGLADDYSRLGMLGLAAAIDRRVANSDRRDAIYLLADPRGRAIAGNLGGWPPTVEPGGGWVQMELIRTDSEKRVHVSAASLSLQGSERLLVGRDASGQQRFDRVLVQSVGWALLAALLLSAITGWLLTRLVFSRISDISDTAKTIVSGDLDRRIPLRGTDDEFDRLAVTLNNMLDRIADLVGSLRMTTNSMAHDLRSPLTRLRAHMDVLSAPDTKDAERDRVAQRALAEVDHLLRVFSNLTEIAHADAHLSKADFDPVDLGALMGDAVDLYQPLAEDHDLQLTLCGDGQTVQGHRTLLMQALSNLIENALRYSPDNSSVTVGIRDLGGSVELSVADNGPGIPDDFLPEAIKPFATADQSRNGEGSGLGLALVAAVARLHGGDIRLVNTSPGLKASFTLKRE